jgi:agmatinase
MSNKRNDEFRGTRNLRRLQRISQNKQDAEIQRCLELGLEAAESINDRSISLFSRGHQPAFAGINTFMKELYCEDIRKVGDYEAAFLGIPFDTGTTYRPGTRFGPQAVRRISAI